MDGGGADTAFPCTSSDGALVVMDSFPSIIGFDLSTVTAFFNFAPFLISPSKASLPGCIAAAAGGGAEAGVLKFGAPGGGGGGGGGGPAMFTNCCWCIRCSVLW